MARKTFWISYDLGIKGDYSGLYTWLDTVGARECGDSIAVFSKEVLTGNAPKEILTEIKKYVDLDKKDRIYLIYRDEKSLNKGTFIHGGRKLRSPWEGYALSTQTAQEDV